MIIIVIKDEERLRNILKEKVNKAAFLAKEMLLEGVESEEFRKHLQYLVSRREGLLR